MEVLNYCISQLVFYSDVQSPQLHANICAIDSSRYVMTQIYVEGELSWLALLSLIVYIATFSLGLGPIPWILMSELLPLRARGKCGGMVTAFNLLCAFIVTKEFHDVQVRNSIMTSSS